jgi:hypothetical protein
MRTRIAVGLVAAFAAGMPLVPMSAKAACTQIIYAERATLNSVGTTIVGRNTSTDAFSWSAFTTNAQFANLIFSAVAQRNRLFVAGGAASCPADGTLRGMGTITQIIQQP